MPKSNRCGQAAILSREQLNDLTLLLPPLHRALCQTARFTAGRIAEVRQLQWENVLNDHIVFPKKITKGKVRTPNCFCCCLAFVCCLLCVSAPNPRCATASWTKNGIGTMACKVGGNVRKRMDKHELRFPVPMLSPRSHWARCGRQDAAFRVQEGRLQRRVHSHVPPVCPYCRKRCRDSRAEYHESLGSQIRGQFAKIFFMQRITKT